MQQIGVLGASFNPPTVGHRDVIEQAKAQFDEILLVPSLSHAFFKQQAPIAHRIAMLNLFIDDIQNNKNKIKIFNIEESLQKTLAPGSPIYTYDVLTRLSQYYQALAQSFQIHFIVGPDISDPKVWQKFYRYDEIEKNWPLFIVKEKIPVHSTMVREAVLKNKHSLDRLLDALIPLVGEKIAKYIIDHQLYQEKEGVR